MKKFRKKMRKSRIYPKKWKITTHNYSDSKQISKTSKNAQKKILNTI